ncbi:MAG: hypothetical protein Kow0059_16790 [Candidatus Sumerlaeia bacterium]
MSNIVMNPRPLIRPEARGMIHSACAACILIAWLLAAGAPQTPAQGLDENVRAVQIQALEDHLIAPTPQGLLAFLRNGFPPDVDWDAQPEFPANKTDVYLYALQELGRLRERAAFDIIAALARGETNPGLERIFARDLEAYRPADRPRRETVLRGAVRYNAIVALGLLGDTRALPILHEQFDQIGDERWRIQIALALATLGDGSHVSYLVELVKRQNQQDSVWAHDALRFITGKDWGYRSTTSVRMRDKLANDVALWWLGNRESFQPEPEQILRRRYFMREERRPVPVSVRDLLEAASRYPDPQNRYHANYARTTLDRLGRTIVKDMRAIAEDVWEDVMVRREAMRRLYDLEGSDARGLLKKLRKDENPEVAALADRLLERMKEEK